MTKKMDRREFGKDVLKKAAWIVPIVAAVNMPETVCAVQSGNNGWGNGNQNPPGNSGPHNNAENQNW